MQGACRCQLIDATTLHVLELEAGGAKVADDQDARGLDESTSILIRRRFPSSCSRRALVVFIVTKVRGS
jgi:hypothetical protein